MNRPSNENGVVTDKIVSIRKVGNLDIIDPSPEIFLTFENHGTYSIDRFCCSYFEDVWLNARVGMVAKLYIYQGSIGGFHLENR